MAQRVSVPIKEYGGEIWGDLNSIHNTHDICAESVKLLKENFSFAGQHRVRLYRFKKNVFWKVPAAGLILDISDIMPDEVPRKKPNA